MESRILLLRLLRSDRNYPCSSIMESRKVESTKQISILRRLEWPIAIIAIVGILIAWFAGDSLDRKRTDQLVISFMQNHDVELLAQDICMLNKEDSSNYLVFSESVGYSGKVKVLTTYSSGLSIEKIDIVSHSETYSYFQRLNENDFFDGFTGIEVQNFESEKPDAITGATKSTDAINKAVSVSNLKLAEHLNFYLKNSEQTSSFIFGFKEALLLIIFGLGILFRILKGNIAKLIKWLSVITSVVFLGFLWNNSLSLAKINTFLLGFWFDDLFYLIMILATLLILIISGRNYYCNGICPFGNLQDLVSLLGNAKEKKLILHQWWKWLQRSLAWIAIILALLFRNPGLTDFTVFSAAFDFTASDIIMGLTALMLLMSLFFKRFWCSYLCPVGASLDLITLFRTKTRSLWKREQS